MLRGSGKNGLRHDKRVHGTYLFQQPSLLDDVRDRLHLHTFRFVDVLEGVQISRLLMLNYADLRAKGVNTSAAKP